MTRLGLFGGTFNPPHLAHKALALKAAAAASLDTVLIMPDAEPPHKAASGLISGEDRLELCRRTFTEPVFAVSDMELRRTGKSYTVYTVREVRERYAPDELYLSIGSDMLLTFAQWREWETILSMAKLIVLSREPDVSPDDLARYAETVLGLSREKGDLLILTDLPQVLSSTEIRFRVQSGEPIDALVTEEAMAYIYEKGFYR